MQNFLLEMLNFRSNVQVVCTNHGSFVFIVFLKFPAYCEPFILILILSDINTLTGITSQKEITCITPNISAASCYLPQWYVWYKRLLHVVCDSWWCEVMTIINCGWWIELIEIVSDVEKRKCRLTSRLCILWGVFLVLCLGVWVPSGSSRIPLSISLMCVYNCPLLLCGSNLLCVLFFLSVWLRLMWLSSYP